MVNISEVLYDKITSVISGWDDDDIYAVSFFVYSNPSYEYNGIENVSQFSISYNTEDACPGAGKYDEERWNYAFWLQDETPVIDIDNSTGLTEMLFQWYKENGISDIGYEDNENDYDENGAYIGKGPAGHYELLGLAAEAGRRIQEEGLLKKKYGKPIPIIVHGLEYVWYDIEATKKANPNNEAKDFLKAIHMMMDDSE